MSFFIKITCITGLMFLLFSCKKDEDLDVVQPNGLGGETWARGPIDKWLMDSLTKPYNIAVKYRWDAWELKLNKTLTPPDESKVVPAMSAVKRVWIDPYNAETGSTLFIKKYSPKQFVLVGSVEYQFNGTVTLGQAEGGNSIVFFDINQNFDKNNASSIRRMIQTSHHEFAHILHQTVMYPQDYKFITSNLGLPGYTATWFNISPNEALQSGYITPYSMASYDEDFVEMIANMLMEGRQRFDEIVATANPTAQAALKAKEEIVVNYFEQVWGINFYSLQNRVQAALKSLEAVPTVNEAFGFGKTYTVASVNIKAPALLPQSPSFLDKYKTSESAVAALPYNLTMDSMAVINAAANEMILRIYLLQNGQTFFADYRFTVSKGANDIYTYTYKETNGNGNAIIAAVKPLLDYFKNNSFAINWYADPGVSIMPRVRFVPQASADGFFTARLLP